MAARARRQDDVVTRAEVRSLGGTDHYIETRVRAHRWQSPYPGVYVTRAAPLTWRQWVRASLAAAGDGAVASHRAAAALWALDGAEEGAVELTTRYAKGPENERAVLHRTRRWEPDLFVVRDGILVTDVARTLCDYAEVVPPILVERAVEDALRRGLISEGFLTREASRLVRPRVKGPQRVLSILDGRPQGKAARSGFEVMLLDVCRQYGLPLPARNYTVCDSTGTPVAEIDLAWPAAAVGGEAMGRKSHSTTRQRRRDAERRVRVERLGWRLEDIYWEDVVFFPADLATRLARALGVSIAA